MNTFSHVPPGFRFHPTDEELVDYYLRKKVASKRIDLDIIKDVDLYKIEPWDLEELCKIGTDDENEWYFFSHKDKKYPTGTRTNRATKAGFWKATGRDKAIYINRHSLVGMRKTLVFYKGRAPNGQKSDWIMHEYRLETNENGTPQEEGWAVCKVFKKRMVATMRKLGDDSACWYDEQVVSLMPADQFESPTRVVGSNIPNNYNNNNATSYQQQQQQQQQYTPLKQELELQYNNIIISQHGFLQLPQLESPKVSQSAMQYCSPSSLSTHQEEHMQVQNCQQQSMQLQQLHGINMYDQAVDWRVLDKFVASQLSSSHDQDDSKETTTSFSNVAAEQIALLPNNESKKSETTTTGQEYYASASNSSDPWKYVKDT